MTIGGELRRAFHLASMRKEYKDILTGRQREQARKLIERCEDLRKREDSLYEARFLTRVEEARRKLINQAGAVRKEFKPGWMGEDRFNKAATLRQAQRDVRAHHQRRIARIDSHESAQLSGLLNRARKENRIQGKARDAFNKTVDRRGGLERRQSKSRARCR